MGKKSEDEFDVFAVLDKYVHTINPGTREKSWEWCHQAFMEIHKKDKNEITERDEEYLALHLGFYLASWGMYRGSSFLLQRDYKAHMKAVKIILYSDSDSDSDYELLWDYEPEKGKDGKEGNIRKANEYLFSPEEESSKTGSSKKGVYWKIKNCYKSDEHPDDIATDTLVTKILLGTFGCIPAFDRLLKKGISCYNEQHSDCNSETGDYTLTQSTEKGDTKKGLPEKASQSFMALATFACDENNKRAFEKIELNSDVKYPPMKYVDMYFWELGKEKEEKDSK